MSPEERALRAQVASHASWANTTDRAGRTSNARAAREQKFLDAADGDPERAAQLKSEHYATIAAKAHEARRQKRDAIAAEAARRAEMMRSWP